MHVSAIVAAGGRGTRFGGAHPKQIRTLGGLPILQRSVDAFLNSRCINEGVVSLPAEMVSDPPAYLRRPGQALFVVEGGARRQDSVANAFARVSKDAEIVVIHDAARPMVTGTLIERVVGAAAEFGAAIAAVRASDTVKQAEDGIVRATLPRDAIFLAQTPQAFRVEVLRDALAIDADATDEAVLAERAGHRVRLVEGDPSNIKITTADDLVRAELWMSAPAAAGIRIGNGYDLHRLVTGRPLILGGVTIPFEQGLIGHSDADAVCHAVTDALLGAGGLGDIGRLFPDTDAAWKDANSLDLLARAAAVVREAGYAVVNVDVVVIAQKPKLAPYAAAMAGNLARAIGIPPAAISVKGKTNEGVDSMGAGESIAVHAVALLQRGIGG